MDAGIWLLAAVVPLAFAAEYVDSSLGMGYGTTLSPILLAMGFEPLQVVPAILVSELVTGVAAGFTHHHLGNVDLMPRTTSLRRIVTGLRRYGPAEAARRGLPPALRIATVIGAASVAGTVVAALVALRLPATVLTLYIGGLVVVLGVVMIATRRTTLPFSWRRILGLGVIASFNKGISGGGYGPVVTTGQVLSGVDVRASVAITSAAEAVTCAAGVVVYLAATRVDWALVPVLTGGALLSVPLTGITVRRLDRAVMRTAIGVATLGLGALALVRGLL